MKYVLFLVLALTAAVFLMTRSTGAEQEEVKPAMVTKVYDLSRLFAPSLKGAYRLDFADDIEELFIAYIENNPDPPTLKEHIRDLIDWKDDDPGELVFASDQRLIARDTPERIRKIDRAVDALLPRHERFQLGFALLSSTSPALPSIAALPNSLDDSVRTLTDRGFSLQWMVHCSVVPSRTFRLATLKPTAHVADLEGFVATAATAFQPVVRDAKPGTVLTLRATEVGEAMTLACAVTDVTLKGIRTVAFGGVQLHLPDYAFSTLHRQLPFPSPGTTPMTWLADGRRMVLLVTLE
ncbi:MAG: hypothetical protein WC712_02885 [Candidatus Brocadiia bacterium]